LKLAESTLSIKVLAGENVNTNVVSLGESMDTDVTFGDENKPRYPPIFRFGAYVFKYIGRSDLGHSNCRGVAIKEFVNRSYVSYSLQIACEPIDN